MAFITEHERELLASMSQEANENIHPSIQVNAGEQINFPSGATLTLQNVIISNGGKLCIVGPTKEWTKIYIRGDLIILGELSIQGFRRTNTATEEFKDLTKDGRPLQFKYNHTALGGKGGKGKDQLPGNGGKGGQGAAGGLTFGGGGGGGCGYKTSHNEGTNGADGVDASGGEGGPWGCYNNVCGAPGGKGGNGGKLFDADGGMLFLQVDGEVTGKGGLVNGSGLSGISGDKGEDANGRAGGQGGGGGGGAPGGHGGCLILVAHPDKINSLPELRFNGGQGGPGGNGGTGWHGPAESGFHGDNGGNGKFEMYEPSLKINVGDDQIKPHN